MHSASAKKRKKSSKRSKGREDSGSRIRSRERLENKTLECNSAINTYQNSMGRKDQSPLSFLCQERMNFDDDEHQLHYMQDSIILNGQLKNIEKNLKKKVKSIDIQRPKTDNTANPSSRYSTEFDEQKLQFIIKSISEVSDLHPSSHKFFSQIKEGIED